MTFVIFFFFLTYATIVQTMKIQCECIHITVLEDCKNSAKCIWNQNEERCIQTTVFSTKDLVTTYCAQFAQDDCIKEKNCAFYLGKCQEFVSCENFIQEKCDQSSWQCISDGNKCISKGQCSDYQSQIACQKVNLQGKYCKWRKRDDQQICEDVQDCKDLPVHLNVDSDCRKQMEQCTISLKGGCENSQNYCIQYTQKEQCYFSLDKSECFWEDNVNKCLDYICTNKQSSDFQECQKIDGDCTTDGHRCIYRLDCNQYQNSNSCVEDQKGNKCIFYKGKCYQKKCTNAPNFINTLIECQVFNFGGYDCVPKKLGGCKMIPQQCEELETDDSCLSIKELNGKQCIWLSQQQVCKVKQCSDAPLQYNHMECINWLDDYVCIGGVENGCIDNVDDCTQIQNLMSCEKDKLNRKCMIENGQCMEEKCENLQFPFYDNIFACENKIKICTYNYYKKTCINKECSQLEDRQCDFDYNMNKCIQLSGCIHKKCESAYVFYETHEQCQNWDIRCTINQGIINDIPYRNGCITKYLDCTDFKYQMQCVTTLQGIPCYWNQTNNLCEFHNCQNAPLSLNNLTECQKWVQYHHNIKCINKKNGGCIQQATNCSGLSDDVQCLNGSLQGLCFWNASLNQCQDRTCENASNVTNNQECRQWLSSCIFQHPKLCRSQSNTQIQCKDFPINHNFTTHKNCQAWNPNCTLKNGDACFNQDKCNMYTSQEECQHIQKTYNCTWNTNSCEQKQCNVLTNPSNDNDCKSHSPSCTITTTTISDTTTNSCIDRETKCFNITTEEKCKKHSITEKCEWKTSQSSSALSCQVVPCNVDDGSFQDEQKCKDRQFNCIYNSSRSKCEILKDYCSSLTMDVSYLGCQQGSKQCILNELSNKCVQIEKCSDTTTYHPYECNKIYEYCQKKNFTSGCQNLAQKCSDYTIKENCQINSNRQKCYWATSSTKCIDLKCSIIEENLTTHNECQLISSDCTIFFNIDIPQKCMDLLNCSEYQKKEQCFIDKLKQSCSWINNQCIFDESKTAPLGIYTLQRCQELFGSKSTINEDRSGCITKLDNCHQYNKFQCLTPNQTNFNDVQCFWDQSDNECKEVLCHKANQQTKQLIECEQFNQNCQTKLCKVSICNDYKYDTDNNCKMALINNKCTTNGTICIERGLCSDVMNRAGCTFSIHYQDCIWLEDENRCVDKTCNSALSSLNTHKQCQDYLEQCTNKIEGGCVTITTCYSISSPEACINDQNNEQCTWDEFNKKCIYIQCQSLCGDGVVGDSEQCDDGNILPYDGCYKCRFQCQYGCNSCIKMNCQECSQGFELKQNGLCEEICGDGLIVGQEECDDMNTIENDGCDQCRFQCHEKCLECIFGICSRCVQGWEEYNTQCQSVCGNGLLVESFEQCDDGNTDDDDGCNSKCQIEQNWICVQSQNISECKYVLPPKIILLNLSQKKDSQQIIRLKFSQKVQLKSDIRFEDFIKINVTNNIYFQFVIQPIVEASLLLSNVEYNIYITLLEKVDHPQVSIQFIQSIFINQYKQELQQQMDTINLGQPLILSLEQQSRLKNTIAFNEIMIYVFIGSSSLSVLMGNLDLFFNMLTLLQSLSYVRYLSVPFPSHLNSYLKVFKVVSFQPLYDQLKIDQLFEKLNFGKVPFIQQKNNQKQDAEFNNSFFLVNAKSFYLTMFLSIFCYVLTRLIIKSNKFFYKMVLKINTIKKLNRFYKIFKSIRSFAIKSSNYFIYSGLIKIFISSEYQLMYSAYSQFPEYNFNFNIENLFATFNSFNALICMIIPHIFLFKSVAILQKQYNTENVNKYSIFYENVKPDYWSRFTIPFSMIKVSMYMAIICFLFDSEIIQLISLIILQSSFCYYLIAIQPFIQKIELLKQLIREITFLFTISSFFPYCLSFNDDIINILGWIHIGLFSFIIGSNIVLDAVKQVLDLRQSYKRNQIKIKQTLQRQYIINGLQQFVIANSKYQQNIYNCSLSIGFEAQSNQQSQILSLH